MMIVFNFFYSIGKALEGMVRGLGKHAYSTGVLIIGFYLVSAPVIMKRLQN